MKNDFVMDEIKNALKRLEKKNNMKTVLVIGAGIAIVILAVVYLVMKLRDKLIWGDYDDYDDDWDEFDYEDYADDYDEDDIEEDYSALDFEEMDEDK